MECPHCKEELKIPPRAFRAIEAYNSGVHVTTECCDKMIFLSGEMRFSARQADSRYTEDDWGVEVK